MPETLRDNLRVHPGGEPERRVSVTEIMQANPRQLGRVDVPVKGGRKRVRVSSRRFGRRDLTAITTPYVASDEQAATLIGDYVELRNMFATLVSDLQTPGLVG